MNAVHICKAGRLSYARAWSWQRNWHALRRQNQVPDLLLLTEHPPTYTCGCSTRPEHLLWTPDQLTESGFEFFEIERGGSVTYHGPGQLVGYPLVDLRAWGRDVHQYMRRLEEILVRTLAAFDLRACPVPDLTGVWVGRDKVAAIGIYVRHWISMHGFALNIDPDLDPFKHILPCGLDNEQVTSMERLLGAPPPLQCVEAEVQRHFATVFEVETIEIGLDAVRALVEPDSIARLVQKL